MKQTPLFLYCYEKHTHIDGSTSKTPTITMALVPHLRKFPDGDKLRGIGVGLTICSGDDNPCKKTGKTIALRRAAWAIRKRKSRRSCDRHPDGVFAVSFVCAAYKAVEGVGISPELVNFFVQDNFYGVVPLKDRPRLVKLMQSMIENANK